MGRPILITGPTSEPITPDEAKAHLNITGSSKDVYINSLIVAARRRIERYLQRALISQTWDCYFSCFKDCLELPFPPLVSITSVKYKDLDGAEQTLTHGNYYHTVIADVPGKLVRKHGVTFPETEYENPDSVIVRYVAGYDSAAAVPAEIKHAMKLMLTDYYEHRGTVVVGNIAHKIPGHITDLIHSYKVYEF